MGEMRMKDSAPPFARPTSPDRRFNIRLADIPETTPSPNAFAQQAARIEKHRLETNAFYQQEMQKRAAAPPNTPHPALRGRSVSDPRLSTCTTMSPFVNVADEEDGFPPLKLLPSNADQAMPTWRGFLEEENEQLQYERGGGKDERIPVFVPTPRIACVDFAKPAEAPRQPRVEKEKEKEKSVSEMSMKTPKKGIFSKLKLSTNLRGHTSPSTATVNSLIDTESKPKMPVKAQAVLGSSPPKGRQSLGSSPSKISIPRSPSKRKNFFSRKNSTTLDSQVSSNTIGHTTGDVEDPPPSASHLVKTPPTAISDPTHYSYYNKRQVSQNTSASDPATKNDSSQCLIARSQSLKYFDHAIPPTPPAKNTPPDEKAKRDAALAKKSSRLPFHDEETTPSKEPAGFVSISGRVSPTRYGSYGHKEMPTLVTKPSMYSLHASVVPNLTEANTFEEMKARIDGLGLEGFSMPPENVRSPQRNSFCSASIYSPEWGTRPTSVFINPNGTSVHTKGSSSSGVEIPICYPDLAKDPSLNRLTPSTSEHFPGAGETRGDTVPHSGSIHSLKLRHHARRSVDSNIIFASHTEDDCFQQAVDSPTSFSHLSAAPSPLQPQATKYTPPPRFSSKLPTLQAKAHKVDHPGPKAAPSGLGIVKIVRPESATPDRKKDVFDNAPDFSPGASGVRSKSPSPVIHRKDQVDVDPQKISPMKNRNPSSDKLDRMIDMLNTLQTRNNEISTMRDEMRTTNARLDLRLAAVEDLQRVSPAPSGPTEQSSHTEDTTEHEFDKRVSTSLALDFYRMGQIEESTTSHEDTTESDVTDNETIAELKETNRRLLEMVGGFADKLQALEKKVRR